MSLFQGEVSLYFSSAKSCSLPVTIRRILHLPHVGDYVKGDLTTLTDYLEKKINTFIDFIFFLNLFKFFKDQSETDHNEL